MSQRKGVPLPHERAPLLDAIRKQKMARSAHAYVRGNTALFYEWMDSQSGDIPQGPPVWIGGDCHVGNLGPLADRTGDIRVQIRDLDQTTIGNPAHDLIRLALSLSSAARGSDLPGVTTARILEGLMDGYESAFIRDFDEEDDHPKVPQAVKLVVQRAEKRTWKHLANERMAGERPDLPLGKKFWPISDEERAALATLTTGTSIANLATTLKSREDDAQVEMLDAAYWVKGCSSLGDLRYAVLLSISESKSGPDEMCLMDFKEAVEPLAPPARPGSIPDDNGDRVVMGAQHISPFLGERMRATHLLGKSMFVRELMPQDLKIELATLTEDEAIKSALFLASVVGYAHARQMDTATRTEWRTHLKKNRSKDLDAPPWLWSATVDLLVRHERQYLEHCRKFALEP
jgi:uncharacterized protein (DUF2252 family)